MWIVIVSIYFEMEMHQLMLSNHILLRTSKSIGIAKTDNTPNLNFLVA